MAIDHGGKMFFGTIMDLGVSEGNDTAYYLQKGFRVVAVEADPEMCQRLHERFGSEIANGSLQLLNFAASDKFGVFTDFYVHRNYQGVSGLTINPDLDEKDYKPSYRVQTIDWNTLLAQGKPYYVKIDIENQEEAFLSGMKLRGDLPEFISVECHALTPVECLRDMGYERFVLVDQASKAGFRLPKPQLEGHSVESPNFGHASGPFGLDVFGEGNWTDFEGFRRAWTAVQPRRAEGTWFDCHAWKPKSSNSYKLRLSERVASISRRYFAFTRKHPLRVLET